MDLRANPSPSYGCAGLKIEPAHAHRGAPPLMKTLVLANQKGGVGKSAVATLLAQDLRRRGCRVLAIDLDHQANFTHPITL
jgi:Mrp family chromosome partitioning ATPase